MKLCAINPGNICADEYEAAIASALGDLFESTGVDLFAQVEEAAGITGGADV